MWALFGYSDTEPYGTFLAERVNKDDLKEIEDKARNDGYTSFSYGHADGTLPNFAKTVNVGGRIA